MSFTEERKIHYSDCATHNEPAFPNGECDCDKMDRVAARAKAAQKQLIKEELGKLRPTQEEVDRFTGSGVARDRDDFLDQAINLIEKL